MVNYLIGVLESQGVGIWKLCLLVLVEYVGVVYGVYEVYGKGWRIIVVL